MRLETLQSFIKVVELGSYAAAADVLFTSPTTLHSQIKALEQELNLTLVSFLNHQLELTYAGTELLAFAERTLADYDTLRGNALTPASGHRYQELLRVVSLPGPGVVLLPPVIRAFQASHPYVRVTVETRHTEDTLAALASHRADVAILHDVHVQHAKHVFDMSPVLTDRLVCVVRQDLAKSPDRVLFDQHGLAVQGPSNFSRQYVAQWARATNTPLHILYEHSTFEGILTYVMLGDCIGVVGEYCVTNSPSRALLHVLDLPTFQHERTLVAVYSTKAGPIVRTFIDALRRHYSH